MLCLGLLVDGACAQVCREACLVVRQSHEGGKTAAAGMLKEILAVASYGRR